MGLLLDVAYLLACVAASPWIVYRLCASGRRDFAMRFGIGLGAPLTASVWLHGSSAGEISVLRPLVAALERDLPEVPVVISAFTITGLVAARKLYPQHRVVLLPIDLSFVVARCVRRFDPRALIIAESEFWPNLVRAAKARGKPVVLVNGKMSKKSFRIHSQTHLIPRVLAQFDLLAVQTEEHARRFAALGVAPERLRVTGNMKYDLLHERAAPGETAALRRALGYATSDIVIVGGSLHEREDEALLDAYLAARAACADAVLIVVPRYPADAERVQRNIVARGLAAARKTAVDAGTVAAPGRTGILVVDTMGELGRLYAIADVAFVGGSLFYRGANKGGHNLMEPAILGVPVLFGPYNFSFKETVDELLAANAGTLVRDGAELTSALVALVARHDERRELGLRGQQVVLAGQGATARNYALLEGLLRTTS